MKPTSILLTACGLTATTATALLIAAPALEPAAPPPSSPPSVSDSTVAPAHAVRSAGQSSHKAAPDSPGPKARRPKPVPDTTVDEADGVLPNGVTVFDDEYPGIARLDPRLLKALREAAKEAKKNKVVFYVSSAWRSHAYQEQLLQLGIATYGSAEEAARWIAPPDRSLHVAGEAIDTDGAATKWLGKRGARFGLCRVYENEPWHFELRPEAVTDGCPPLYPDPTADPRLQ